MLQWLERLDLAPRDRIVPVSGLLGVAAHHRLSRAKDPHLHSHSVLANALVADDGVHTLALGRLRRVAPALELLYRVELRQGLAEVGRKNYIIEKNKKKRKKLKKRKNKNS
jgi:hypothetical protein